VIQLVAVSSRCQPNIPLGYIDLIGFSVWLVGLTIETVADFQKLYFVSTLNKKIIPCAQTECCCPLLSFYCAIVSATC
jgi:steroid 5-alpha reductase family enzyme